jgi:hypothetical protein
MLNEQRGWEGNSTLHIHRTDSYLITLPRGQQCVLEQGVQRSGPTCCNGPTWDMNSHTSILQVVNDVPVGLPLMTLTRDGLGTLHQLQSNAIEFGDPQEPNQESKVNLQESCGCSNACQCTHPM